ncbi:MAG: hypothetical protein CM15mP103_07880 [Gammaproteobacteria bacterium]|nr:MAG: hypothetical protein CM15mP103_07880 [Gammaproteobacteria bacterium]
MPWSSVSLRIPCHPHFWLFFTSAAIAVVCFLTESTGSQPDHYCNAPSGIQQAIQHMLKREKCLVRALFISLFTIVALAAQPALVDDVDTAIENSRGAGARFH